MHNATLDIAELFHMLYLTMQDSDIGA